jgi:hypothetical protein
MAKTPQKREGQDDIELHPDAWERFTEFVKRIAKAGPQHRAAKRRKKGSESNDAKRNSE